MGFKKTIMSKGKKATTPRRGRSASRGRTQQKSAPARSKSRGRPKSRSNSRNSKKTEPKPQPRQTRSRSISKPKPKQVTPKTVSPPMAPRETPEVVPPPAVISPAPILPIPSMASNQSEVIQNEPIREENGPVIPEKKSESIISSLTLYTAVLIVFSLCLWSLTNLTEKGRVDILPGWWFTFKRDNEQNLPDPVSVAISSISVLVAKASWKLLKHYQ